MHPILERPKRGDLDCAATVPLTKLGLNPWAAGSLATSSGRAFLVYGQKRFMDEMSDRALLSSIDANGTRGPEIELGVTPPHALYSLEVVPRDGGLTALWMVGNGFRREEGGLYIAVLDEQGATTHVKHLADSEGEINFSKLAKLSSGYALLYSVRGEISAATQVQLALLDEAGELRGAPKTIASVVSGGWLDVVALPDGVAVSYSEVSTQSRLFLALFDSGGEPRGEPLVVTQQAEYTLYSQDLLVRGNELLMAYTEHSGDLEAQEVAGTIQLAKFDATTGARILAPQPLQAPLVDVENVDPELIALGDNVGLVWSQGSVIYICAGCMPDNHLNFVVLDGESLDPVSELVTLENRAPAGGFTQPRLTQLGDDILIASSLEYHTSSEGAFATVRCQPSR